MALSNDRGCAARKKRGRLKENITEGGQLFQSSHIFWRVNIDRLLSVLLNNDEFGLASEWTFVGIETLVRLDAPEALFSNANILFSSRSIFA